MGYILPVAHYQYQDYHERVQPIENDPFYIDPVFKANLEEQLREREPREQDRKDYQDYKQEQEAIYTSKTIYASKVHKIYSELTGIGRHFNESI
ncbi:hypothetical protein [Pontibacillus marinus]|uniref:Uncharacterized protein n=1 Tax=Pontibacillus marinus BH030004 = DSM 16465 TaxID=1385511 RepID=A0A0A5G074_9BACI|nr:hypothetical protein [Pontibacillus marinus]KGX85449.1 hypothetical protein N783_14655 [Pontibacillus marinus BH030004 = DSM 16465]